MCLKPLTHLVLDLAVSQDALLHSVKPNPSLTLCQASSSLFSVMKSRSRSAGIIQPSFSRVFAPSSQLSLGKARLLGCSLQRRISAPRVPWEHDPATTGVTFESASPFRQDLSSALRGARWRRVAEQNGRCLPTCPVALCPWPSQLLLSERKARILRCGIRCMSACVEAGACLVWSPFLSCCIGLPNLQPHQNPHAREDPLPFQIGNTRAQGRLHSK